MAADKNFRRFGTFFRFLQRITSRGSTVLNMAAVLRLQKWRPTRISQISDTFFHFLLQGGVGDNLTWLHSAGYRPKFTRDGGGQC